MKFRRRRRRPPPLEAQHVMVIDEIIARLLGSPATVAELRLEHGLFYRPAFDVVYEMFMLKVTLPDALNDLNDMKLFLTAESVIKWCNRWGRLSAVSGVYDAGILPAFVRRIDRPVFVVKLYDPITTDNGHIQRFAYVEEDDHITQIA